MTDRYEHDERVAIATEAGVAEERARAIAECEEAMRIGLSETCDCGAGHVLPKRLDACYVDCPGCGMPMTPFEKVCGFCRIDSLMGER